MILYQPATLHSDSIERPNCSECGSTTDLFGIEAAERSGYELLTFVCPKCEHIETAVERSAATTKCDALERPARRRAEYQRRLQLVQVFGISPLKAETRVRFP